MSPETATTTEPAGVPVLLVLMSTATVLATAVIAISLATESWIGMAIGLLSVAVGTACVLAGIARTLDDR